MTLDSRVKGIEWQRRKEIKGDKEIDRKQQGARVMDIYVHLCYKGVA